MKSNLAHPVYSFPFIGVQGFEELHYVVIFQLQCIRRPECLKAILFYSDVCKKK